MKMLIFAFPICLLLYCSTVTLEAQVAIENSLQGVELVGVETTSSVIKLTLKNVSPRNITAIDLAYSESNIMTIDSAIELEDVLLAPSANKVIDIGFMPEHPISKVTILAVIFDDGSGEGVPARLDFIKNNRLARRDQMRRIVPLWSSLLITAQAGDQQALGQLLDTTLAEVSALPETPAVEAPMPNSNYAAQQIGLQGPKQSVVRDIHQIQRLLTENLPKEGLEHFVRLCKERYDKVLTNLEAGCLFSDR